MATNSNEKFFSPRLVDYFAVVGNTSFLENTEQFPTASDPSSLYVNLHTEETNEQTGRRLYSLNKFLGGSASNSQSRIVDTISCVKYPQLLTRYPKEDHEDFPLPSDIVCFCQPEGCTTLAGGAFGPCKSVSFMFTITDKDTVRTRYGVCVNFYRTVKKQFRSNIEYDSVAQLLGQESSDSVHRLKDGLAHNVKKLIRPGKSDRISRSKYYTKYCSLTSLCLVSHYPFHVAFRECLFYLKSLIDICNESLAKCSWNKRRLTLWNIMLQNYKPDHAVMNHYYMEIEKWLLRLLASPAPVPGRTKVEVEIFGPREHNLPVTFALPDRTRFPLLDFPVHLPLELLGVETSVHILTLILLEFKIVFISRDYNILSVSVLSFISLLYPLDYMFPVIPLLPVSLRNSECLLDNPTPFVVGIPANFFRLKKRYTLPNDVWLIDLDSNKIIPPEVTVHVPLLPNPDRSVLENHLRRAINCSANPDRKFTDQFMFRNSSSFSSYMLDGTVNEDDDYAPRKAAQFEVPPATIKGKMKLHKLPEDINWLPKHHTDGRIISSERKQSMDSVNRKFKSIVENRENGLEMGDVDSIDVAVRVAMVRFFNSENMLASLEEHIHTVRLFPRPVVTVRIKSLIHSRQKSTGFIEEFARTQAVEYFAERLLTPRNVTFLRIQTGIVDPGLIGDKTKWFADTLEPVIHSIWDSYLSLDDLLKESTDDTAVSANDEVASYRLHDKSDFSEFSETSTESTESELSSPEFQPSSLLFPSYDDVTANDLITEDMAESLSYCDHSSISNQKSESGENAKEGAINSASTARASISFKRSQDGLMAKVDKISNQAKKAAEEASKSVQGVGKTAAGISKTTFEDLTYVGKNTFEDFTKSAKEVASRTKLLKANSVTQSEKSFTSCVRGPATQATNILNDIFGQKMLAQKSPLIRHSHPNMGRKSAGFSDMDDPLSDVENQTFLKEISYQVLSGESINWLKINRCKKLLEDENNRRLLLSRLNKTLDCKINPSDHIDDAYVNRDTWKSILKILLVVINVIETTYQKLNGGSLASVFQLLEIAHTHYWCKEDNILSSSDDRGPSSSLPGSVRRKPSMASNSSRTSLNSAAADLEGKSQKNSDNINRKKSSSAADFQNLRSHMPDVWGNKSILNSGFRYHGGVIHNILGLNTVDGNRMYIYEGVLKKSRSPIWDDMQFWEDAFLDAVCYEREIVDVDHGLKDIMKRFRYLSENEQKRLAHDEDRLLSTMLYNTISFMLMMNVNKDAIGHKVRSILGKCRITITYAEEINSLLSQISGLRGNVVDLKCVASRLGCGRSYAVHVGSDSTGTLLFVDVRDDGLVMHTINGVISERWWYERIVNMTYSPKNKILCLWKKNGSQTDLHKYYTKKAKELYHRIKLAMERAVQRGQYLGYSFELGGEFPVKDLSTGEGGLLQVCMEGIGLLFTGSRFFVKLKRVRKCFTIKGRYFVLEEYNPKTKQVQQWKYESPLAGHICYSVLCVFSYTAAMERQN